MRKLIKLVVAVVIAAVLLAACNDPKSKTTSQRESQETTESYAEASRTAVPYPLEEMKRGGWLELSLLRENLLRQNNRSRLAYVTLLNQIGQPVAQFTIQGMVFSLNSQMTTANLTEWRCGGGCGSAVTDAPGDNGTYGPEPEGISFFTTEGVQIKWNGPYIESDSPLDLTTKPLVVYDASTAKPSVTAGGVGDVKEGGIKTSN